MLAPGMVTLMMLPATTLVPSSSPGPMTLPPADTVTSLRPCMPARLSAPPLRTVVAPLRTIWAPLERVTPLTTIVLVTRPAETNWLFISMVFIVTPPNSSVCPLLTNPCTKSEPPLLTTSPTMFAPGLAISTPLEPIVALIDQPPDDTISSPPLLTWLFEATPPASMISSPPSLFSVV